MGEVEVIKNQMIELINAVCDNYKEISKSIKKIGIFLKNRRIELNLTKEYVAEKLKISEDDIYRIEDIEYSFLNSDKQTACKLTLFYFDGNHGKYENKSDKKIRKTRKRKEIDEGNLYTAKGFAKENQLPNIIQFWRKRIGISQKELSERLMQKSNEFTKNTINQCERSVVSCTFARRYFIAMELCIDFKKISMNQKELSQFISFKESFNNQIEGAISRQKERDKADMFQILTAK